MQNDPTTSHRAARALLWAGPAAAVAGFMLHRMWEQIALKVDAFALGLAVGVVVLAWLLRSTLRWQLATGIALAWLVLLVVFAGPLPVLATVLLMLAALGLGSQMLPASLASACMRVTFATLAGLALIAGTLGWLLPLPIHRIWLYLLVLFTVTAWRRAAIHALLVPLPDAWRNAVAASPRLAAFALLAVGLASTGCWLPTLQSDDLTYHLALPSQLQQLGYYRLDFASNIWALAPWSSDVLHALVQVIANTEARGALNALWLALSVALLWEIGAGLAMAEWGRWLLIALYASHPIVLLLAGGMLTEGPATAVTLALALLVLRAPRMPDAGTLRLAAVLSGLLLGLKILHAVAIPPLLLWLLWRWRGRLPWRALPGAVALALLIGGSSYAYAWALTGNPLMPLYNGWFRSPAMDAINIIDMRWITGLHWSLPWRVTFETSKYMEAYDGGAGFVLVALSGALLIALRDHKTRALALAGIVTMLLPFWQIQYLRYAQPGLMLLLPVMTAAVATTTGRRTATTLLVALVCLNLAFQTNAYWIPHGGAVLTRVVQGNTETIAQFTPERRIVAYLRAQPGSDRVLFTGYALVAELAGRGYTTTLYDHALSTMGAIAEKDPSGGAWRSVFAQIGVRWVETTPSQASPALKAALADAQRVLVVGNADLWRLPPASIGNRDLSVERDTARRLIAH
jgi:hypothetical protein